MDTQETPKEKKKADPLDMDKLGKVIEELRLAMNGSEEDIDQETLVKMVQKNRAFMLEYAMAAYLDNPKNGELLGSVTSILAAVEKSVREDRKERMKKKDAENNKLAFNQMLDAMQSINNGSIKMPVFDLSDFILDPNKSLVPENSTMLPIQEGELVQGNSVVDIDGNPV
ncbi:hypothetical protein D3C81_190820 [compost metagenome]